MTIIEAINNFSIELLKNGLCGEFDISLRDPDFEKFFLEVEPMITEKSFVNVPDIKTFKMCTPAGYVNFYRKKEPNKVKKRDIKNIHDSLFYVRDSFDVIHTPSQMFKEYKDLLSRILENGVEE